MISERATGFAVGTFDYFNSGQFSFLERAKERCERLVVGIWSDEAAEERWSTPVSQPFVERIRALQNLLCIDELVLEPMDVDRLNSVWNRCRVQTVFVGEKTPVGEPWLEVARRAGLEVVAVPETKFIVKPGPEEVGIVEFVPLGGNSFHLNFARFFHENEDRIDELKSRLLHGMDELSHAVVDRIVSLYRNYLVQLYVDVAVRFETKPTLFLGRKFQAPMFCSEIEIRDQAWQESLKTVRSGSHVAFPSQFRNRNNFFMADYARMRSLCYVDQAHRRLKGRDVLDCGAFIGDSAIIFSELSPRSVHAFEPDPDNFNMLKYIISTNKKEDVIIPVPLATSDKLKTSFIRKDGAGSRLMPDHSGRHGPVSCISIDEYASRNSLDVGLIKMDVEGSEYDSIVGATNTICKDKPVLIISIYHTPKDFFEIKTYLENLQLGYRFEIRQFHLTRNSLTEFELIAYC